ncbi:MFS transporter [Streptomyces albus]
MRDTAGSTVRPAAALFALTLTVSSVLLGSTILNVALPTMQTDLGASTTEQQWFLNAYTLTFAGFLLVAGNAGDRWGLKRLLVWGSAAFAVTTAVAGFLDSPLAIIVLRALMGVAAATIMPTTLAVILRIFPAGDRARAIATWAAASGLSISLGPLLGGALLSADMWWGSVLELVALFALLGLAATLAWIPAIPASGRGELRMMPVAGSLAASGCSCSEWSTPPTTAGPTPAPGCPPRPASSCWPVSSWPRYVIANRSWTWGCSGAPRSPSPRWR